MQEMSDNPTLLNPTVTTEFGLSLVPTTQEVATLFDVTTYRNGRAVGLTFTLNQATDFSTLADPAVSFGITGTSTGGLFVDHAAFFNAPVTIGAGGSFDVLGVVTDANGVDVNLTLLSADETGPTVELPFFGLSPFFPGTNQVQTITFASGAGQIDALSFTLAFLVPEPGTLALVGLSLLGLGLRRRLPV
jgi:hypothetical protein